MAEKKSQEDKGTGGKGSDFSETRRVPMDIPPIKGITKKSPQPVIDTQPPPDQKPKEK